MKSIGVIGFGTMGQGIAQVAASAGHEVHVFDQSEQAVKTGHVKLEKILSRLIEKGRIQPRQKTEILSCIHYKNDLRLLKDCDLVIEAIVENFEIKKQAIESIEPLMTEDRILASNTSALSITKLAACCKVPTRFVGIHFFNPAPVMSLVEVIPALQTHPWIVERTREMLKSWGKLTVLAKDTPGFIVNKVARPFYSESLRILEEGIADTVTIDWAVRELGGFKMGPFQLMDFIGNDVNYAVTDTVYTSFFYDSRYRPSLTQKKLVDAGYLGRKSGKGYYDYQTQHDVPVPYKNQELGEEIFKRILMMLINEAADTIHFNIASKEDIELAMIKGVNYPKGLLAWADELGITDCVDAMDKLFEEYREPRYRCSPLLRKMAREHQQFFPKNISA